MVWYTKSQVKNLKAYRKKYVKRYGTSKLPQAFFHLNDNPAKRCVMTSPQLAFRHFGRQWGRYIAKA